MHSGSLFFLEPIRYLSHHDPSDFGSGHEFPVPVVQNVVGRNPVGNPNLRLVADVYVHDRIGREGACMGARTEVMFDDVTE